MLKLLTPEDLSSWTLGSPNRSSRNSPSPGEILEEPKRKKLDATLLKKKVYDCLQHNNAIKEKPKNVYYLNFIVDNNDFQVLCDPCGRVIVKKDKNCSRYYSYDDDNNRAILINNTVYNYRFIKKSNNQYKLDSDSVLKTFLKEYILEKHKDLFENVGKTTFEEEDLDMFEEEDLDMFEEEDQAIFEEDLNYRSLMWRVINSRTPLVN